MWVRELIAALFLLSFQGPFQNYQKREKNKEKIEGMFWGEWLRAKNIFENFFRNVGRFWSEWLRAKNLKYIFDFFLEILVC